MCRRKSMICVRGEQEPFWDLDSDSHEELIKLRGLKDEKLFDRLFARVEVIPKTDDQFSLNPHHWEFHVDEFGTLPGWFEEEKQLWSDRCIHALTKIIIDKERETGRVGNLTLKEGSNKYPWLKSVGNDLWVNDSAELDAPALESVGNGLRVNDSAKLDAPALESVGNGLWVNSSAKLDAPKLKTVGGNLRVNGPAKLDAPKLKTVGGDLWVNDSAKLDAPKLKTVGGKPFKM